MMTIDKIIEQLDATLLADGRYRYTAPEMGERYDVTLAELHQLQELMSSEDPEIRRDAYSIWCSWSPGEIVPDFESELVEHFGHCGSLLADLAEHPDRDATIPEIAAAVEQLRITKRKRSLHTAFNRLLYGGGAGQRDIIDAMVTLIDRHLSPVVLCPDSGEWIEDNS